MKLATADVEYGDRLSAPPALGACARILEEIEQQLSVAEEPRPILPPLRRDERAGRARRRVSMVATVCRRLSSSLVVTRSTWLA